jgi:hypothetical protein
VDSQDIALSCISSQGVSKLRLKLKSEIIAFLFGAFIILLNFGDNHTGSTIGNLDTIFGLRFWPLMDIIYPLASILIFLAYGEAKGNGDLKFSIKTVMPFIVFILALFLISIDDISLVLNLGLTFPEIYWIVMMYLYPIISFLAFFSFGEANEKANLNFSLG